MRASTPAVLVLVGLAAVASWSGPGDELSERDRITAHLGRVLEVMAESPPPGLTEAQLDARAETMDWLEEYRDAGRGLLSALAIQENQDRPGDLPRV